jgi:hypothetical protein
MGCALQQKLPRIGDRRFTAEGAEAGAHRKPEANRPPSGGRCHSIRHSRISGLIALQRDSQIRSNRGGETPALRKPKSTGKIDLPVPRAGVS